MLTRIYINIKLQQDFVVGILCPSIYLACGNTNLCGICNMYLSILWSKKQCGMKLKLRGRLILFFFVFLIMFQKLVFMKQNRKNNFFFFKNIFFKTIL